MIALFVDPGGTTGWCVMEHDFDVNLHPTLVLAEQTAGDRFPETLRTTLKSMDIDLVVYERFRIHKGTIGESAVPVIKQIGKIEMVCEDLGIPYTSQPPANKSFFEGRLKSFDMHMSGKQHARDAIQHGLYYFMTEAKSRDGRTPSWVLGVLQQSQH